jgi:hypothetical protein
VCRHRGNEARQRGGRQLEAAQEAHGVHHGHQQPLHFFVGQRPRVERPMAQQLRIRRGSLIQRLQRSSIRGGGGVGPGFVRGGFQ